jgi:hypothetical protein
MKSMALDLTKARRIKTGEIITMKGRLLYPALFKPSLPRGETDQSKARYLTKPTSTAAVGHAC